MAALSPPGRLKRRAEFLRLAARGRKITRKGFLMQFSRGETGALRIGFTATKKLGNAVARNRARRRLKEAARLELAGRELAGVELVLVCRKETAELEFSILRANLANALEEALR